MTAGECVLKFGTRNDCRNRRQERKHRQTFLLLVFVGRNPHLIEAVFPFLLWRCLLLLLGFAVHTHILCLKIHQPLLFLPLKSSFHFLQSNVIPFSSPRSGYSLFHEHECRVIGKIVAFGLS